MMKSDILVIGAGILGLSSALYLKRWNPSKRVVVIDRFGGPGQGNSAKSEGGFRNLFTSKTNFILADSTIDFFDHLQKDRGYDIKLYNIGYLWLFSKKQYEDLFKAFKKIGDRGAEIETYDRDDLENMIPDLVFDFDNEEAMILGLNPVDIGVLGKKCGSVDADSLVRAYEQEFIQAGGEVIYGTEARRLIHKPKQELDIPGEPFIWQDSHITGAETSSGKIFAETTVIAAGVWSENLLDPIGIDSFMKPKKRQIFAFKDPKLKRLLKVEGFNEFDILPLTILPKSSILFRPELSEKSLWLACADNLGRAFGLEDDPQPEEDYYTNNVYHVLVKYFPCFQDVRPINMWAGQYAINSRDESPVVSPFPGMIYVGAASGSGIMKCDSLGRITAAIYNEEDEAELYGGHKFKVANLGIHSRNVEKEQFII
jgi:glycine/D-amino acid oxidase-like deaminating enzyme